MSTIINEHKLLIDAGGPGSGRHKQTFDPLSTEPKSKGHLFFTRSEHGTHEYYKAGNAIYRAQVHYPSGTHSGSYLDTQTGYRSSGRFETQNTPEHLAKLKSQVADSIVKM